jgi:hypothetical protein
MTASNSYSVASNAVNPYFQKGIASEINLFQGLVSESIQVIGHNIHYLPRKLQKLDLILGEDTLSKFDLAIPIEMYLKKDQWVDDKDIMSKFGLMADDNVKFSVSKARWETVISKYPGRVMYFNRPQEGDLIYESINKNLYEITFVDRDAPYYQMGTNLMYVLSCRPYVYSSERINTGITEIDDVGFEEVTADLFEYQVVQEDGTGLLQENGSSIIIDGDQANDNFDKTEAFNAAAIAEEWDKSNPFG